MKSTTKYYISVDAGFSYTKIAAYLKGKLITKIFTSNVVKDEKLSDGGKEFYFNGVRYLVDYPKAKGVAHKTSKDDERYLISALYGIYSILKEVGESNTSEIDVDLAINMPVREFRKQDIQDKRKEMYNIKDATIKLGNDLTYRINSISPVPYYEGYGAKCEIAKYLGNGHTISAVDLGSKNSTVVTFNGEGKIVGESSESFEIGCNSLVSNLALEMELIIGASISDDNVRAMLNGSYGWNFIEPSILENVQDTLDRVVIEHLQEIEQKLAEKKVSIKTGYIAFSGGGAELLANHIPTVFNRNKLICKTPALNNAVGGLQRLGVNING